MPFALKSAGRLPNRDFNVELVARGGYVWARQSSGRLSGEVSTVTDTTTSVAVTYLGWQAIQPFASVATNLPTGRSALYGSAANARMDPDLVDIANFGEGFNIGPSIGVNIAVTGSLVLTVSAGYTWRGPFDRENGLDATDPNIQSPALGSSMGSGEYEGGGESPTGFNKGGNTGGKPDDNGNYSEEQNKTIGKTETDLLGPRPAVVNPPHLNEVGKSRTIQQDTNKGGGGGPERNRRRSARRRRRWRRLQPERSVQRRFCHQGRGWPRRSRNTIGFRVLPCLWPKLAQSGFGRFILTMPPTSAAAPGRAPPHRAVEAKLGEAAIDRKSMPVKKLASSLARNIAAWATSSTRRRARAASPTPSRRRSFASLPSSPSPGCWDAPRSRGY